APRGARGDRAGLRAPGPDGDEPVPPDAGAAEGTGNRLAAGDAGRGNRRAGRLRARAHRVRAAHLRPLRRAQTQGVGRVSRPALGLGAGAVPAGLVDSRRAGLGPGLLTTEARTA